MNASWFWLIGIAALFLGPMVKASTIELEQRFYETKERLSYWLESKRRSEETAWGEME